MGFGIRDLFREFFLHREETVNGYSRKKWLWYLPEYNILIIRAGDQFGELMKQLMTLA